MAHYEEDLMEASKHLDGDGIAKLAQVMYLLKTSKFENIWWRIENRVHELAMVKNGLDVYQITNILRAFSRSQDNFMSGSEKLYIHLEPHIIS